MDQKETYYVNVSEGGHIGRIAKFADGVPYGYDEADKEKDHRGG